MSTQPTIPITTVRFGEAVEAEVLAVLRSGTIAQGPVVQRLEQAFADMVGVRHAVAVNNGTTALVAALEAHRLPPGSEVITSPFTFVATLNAILEAGLTARFADIDALDFCVRPDAIAAELTDRTSAVMPVHLYGQCADVPEVLEVLDGREVVLVEDAAQSHGAAIGDRRAGSWGTGCFSLYATKNLTTGEGGIITTDDDTIADRLRVLRNQGMRQRYQYEMAGHNYRLTDLQAAVCMPQLADYFQVVAARRRNAERLSNGLAGVPGVQVPQVVSGRTHVWHQYTLLIDPAARLDRDGLVEHLTAAGVGCGIYYPRVVFDYDCYRDHPRVVAGDVAVARRVAQQCVSLPVHQHLSDADVDRIVETVRAGMGS